MAMDVQKNSLILNNIFFKIFSFPGNPAWRPTNHE